MTSSAPTGTLWRLRRSVSRLATALWVKPALRRARACLDAGAHEKGLALLSDALRRMPDNRQLLNAQAVLQVAQARNGRVASPLAHVQKAAAMDIPTVCQCFWDAEQELSLTELKIDGVSVWPLIRMQQFYRITQMLGLYDAPHPVQNKTRPVPDAATTQALERCAGTAGLPEFDKEIAVLIGTRKVKGEDLYTQALRKEAGPRALVLDRHQGQPLADDAIDLDALFARFRQNRKTIPDVLIDQAALETLENLREFFQRRLGLDIGDLTGSIAFDVKSFKWAHEGFRLFWKAHPVDTLYLTNGYSLKIRAALVAAKDLGIRVVELQHGFISRFHLAYSWPGQDNVPAMPDELWTFGDYWPDVTPLPGSMTHRTIGAPYVKQIAALTAPECQKGLVTVTSQGVVGRQLFDLAVRLAQARQDKDVIFRLHPSEDQATYEKMLQTYDHQPDNFAISHRTPVIFDVLARTDILVGAFSTTLLEGMVLGCRTVVVNLPGIEYMQPIIDRGDALMVQSLDELTTRLDDAPEAQDPSYYYAAPVAPLLGETSAERPE